jgi:DNA-binding transcriptional MerR regulator
MVTPDRAADRLGLSLKELELRTQVSGRTIRSWVDQGLLEAAENRGPGATYPPDTEDRIWAVRYYKEREGQRLEKIRGRLACLTPDLLRAVAVEARGHLGGTVPEQPASEAAAEPPTASTSWPGSGDRSADVRLFAAAESPHGCDDDGIRSLGSEIDGIDSRGSDIDHIRGLREASRRGDGPPLPSAASPSSPPRPRSEASIAEEWRRIRIGADIELHFRKNLDARSVDMLEAEVARLRATLARGGKP